MLMKKRSDSVIVAGFVAGVLVSVFSKTLVLLTGVSIVLVQVSRSLPRAKRANHSMIQQVASRNGIDLLGMLRLRQRVESSRILTALSRNPTFKLAFGTTFALAAFMQF